MRALQRITQSDRVACYSFAYGCTEKNMFLNWFCGLIEMDVHADMASFLQHTEKQGVLT